MRGSLLFVFQCPVDFHFPFFICHFSFEPGGSEIDDKAKMTNGKYGKWKMENDYFFSSAGLTVTLIFNALVCSLSVADSSSS